MAKGFSTMWRATWIGSSRDLPVSGILPVRGVDFVGTIPAVLLVERDVNRRQQHWAGQFGDC